MLDEIQATSLVLLIIAQLILIRGCFGIRQELPAQGGVIGSKFDVISELIDEVAQLISDLTDTIGQPANPQPSSNPMEAILTSLISNMTMPKEHGSQEEREIHPTDEDTKTLETQTQPN